MFTEDTYLLPNWDADPELETETFIQQHTYDAMNRSFLQKTGRLGLPLSTVIHGYDRGGLLYTVQCEAAEKGAKNAVTGISYNEKAQRVGITYGNGSSTAYSYEKDTFRLTRLVTLGMAGKVQDLNYAYDPVGNIARIENEAQDTIFFNNQSVAPSNDYEYDALYRLQRATGREHIGQAGVHANSPDDRTDVFRTNLPHPGDGGALQNYRQYYEYDAVGNMRFVRHLAGLGNLTNRWTKTFAYNNNGTDRNALGVDPATVHSNRLLQYQVGTDLQQFSFDAHGNMMALLPNSGNGQFNTAWDCFDRLGFIQLSNQGTAHYIYDGSGQRSQKIRTDGNRIVKERIYLGSFEIYREFNSDGSVKLERESLLVKDGSRQVALLETKTVDHPSDDSPEQLVRFQYGNHLGSTALELDWTGTIISYEEYYPYGATSYQAMDQTVKAVAKRYRYTGMERDEESGLNYHSARYYLPWLCRWASADPMGIKDGVNVYGYVSCNPIKLMDTTGNYGEAGHFYTVYFVSLAAGMDAETAFKNAFFAQLPDEIGELDAVTAQARAAVKQSISNKERDEVQTFLHALTGSDAKKERTRTKKALKKFDSGSIEFGFLMHRLGDTYAHSKSNGQTYSTGMGHGAAGHTPDEIFRRPALYKSYVLDLYDTLSAQTKAKGKKTRLSRSQVEAFADKIGSIKVMTPEKKHQGKYTTKVIPPKIDAGATEASEIAMIRSLSQTMMKQKMKLYAPEKDSYSIFNSATAGWTDWDDYKEKYGKSHLKSILGSDINNAFGNVGDALYSGSNAHTTPVDIPTPLIDIDWSFPKDSFGFPRYECLFAPCTP
ncbi:RHS repeat domain-containing protein [Maribacter sp. 2-571]|uniref:RHS repeat domain-containing protein n=1 Tax=Maribacter sp. 2-571 TaxID=3417569 RepID=UPI003D33F873